MSTATTHRESTAGQAETVTIAGEERHVMRDATWTFYDWLSDALGERAPFRIAYDGKDIEITVLGPKHERFKVLLGLFIDCVSTGLEIDCEGLGSTTWKRPEMERGIEADSCYYFDPTKIEACEAAIARESNNVVDYPNPDLAVEIELSPSKIDRPAIYRAVKVLEVWHFTPDP